MYHAWPFRPNPRDLSIFMWGGGGGGEIMGGGGQAQFFQRQGVGQKKISL